MAFSLSQSSDTTKKNTLQHRQTYYSKTQTNFFKAYAKQIQFVNRLNTLMTGMQKRKIIKVTEEVKTCNQPFRKYFNERRIVHIKIQDVIAFEQTYDKTNTSPMTHSSSNSNLQQLKRSLLPSITQGQRKKEPVLSNQNTLSQKIFTSRHSKQQLISPVEKQMIKKGFMLMLEKLQTLKKDEFTNETKYLESVLIRECQKLKQYHLGMDDNAWRGPRKSCKGNKMNLVDEIDSEEKIHGIYPIIMKNIREETSAIEKAERTFEALINS